MGLTEKAYDVLIVGGGLAGLFCALECRRHGLRSTVLEARTSSQEAGEPSMARFRHGSA